MSHRDAQYRYQVISPKIKNDSNCNIAIFTSASIFLLLLGEITHLSNNLRDHLRVHNLIMIFDDIKQVTRATDAAVLSQQLPWELYLQGV